MIVFGSIIVLQWMLILWYILFRLRPLVFELINFILLFWDGPILQNHFILVIVQCLAVLFHLENLSLAVWRQHWKPSLLVTWKFTSECAIIVIFYIYVFLHHLVVSVDEVNVWGLLLLPLSLLGIQGQSLSNFGGRTVGKGCWLDTLYW